MWFQIGAAVAAVTAALAVMNCDLVWVDTGRRIRLVGSCIHKIIKNIAPLGEVYL
jgi:hypothetical protein